MRAGRHRYSPLFLIKLFLIDVFPLLFRWYCLAYMVCIRDYWLTRWASLGFSICWPSRGRLGARLTILARFSSFICHIFSDFKITLPVSLLPLSAFLRQIWYRLLCRSLLMLFFKFLGFRCKPCDSLWSLSSLGLLRRTLLGRCRGFILWLLGNWGCFIGFLCGKFRSAKVHSWYLFDDWRSF